jgi:hypothetical protein
VKRESVRNGRGTGRRLTWSDRYLILELRKQNPTWSFTQLAAATGVAVETARLTCIAAEKTAADLMAAFALPALKHWAAAMKIAGSRGDHRPSRDWLVHSGSLDPIPETQRAGGAQIVIVNTAAMPGMPAGQPLITIDTVNAALPDAAVSTLPDKVDPD